MLVIRAGIHKMLVRIVNREDPDQTEGIFGRQLELEILEHLPYSDFKNFKNLEQFTNACHLS